MCTRCLFDGALLTTECSRCVRTRDYYVDKFEREYKSACDEYDRLRQLFKDVCWYNHETHVRKWQQPWRRSFPDSPVELHSHRYSKFWNRGHLREAASFPYYYSGAVEAAPHLPPQIVLAELQKAGEYVQACKENVTAPLDWAPGGSKYESLLRVTLVGTTGMQRHKRKLLSGVTCEPDGPSGATPFAP